MTLSERLDFLSQWLLIGCIGLLPFFLIPTPIVSITQGKIVLAAAILIIVSLCTGVARLRETHIKIPAASIFFTALLIPLTYVISAAVNGFAPLSLFGDAITPDTLAIAFMMFAFLVLVMHSFAGSMSAITKAIRALFVGGLIAVVLQVAHMLIPGLNLGAVFAAQTANVFGSWHELAMLSGLFVVLGLALQKTPISAGWWRYVFYVTVVCSVIVLALGAFLDVWLMILLALVTLMLVRGHQARALRSEPFWRAQWLLIIVALLALFFAVFGSYISNALPEKISVAHVEVRPSWTGTIDVSRQSLSDPIRVFFGTGPNTFTREWGLHKPLAVNETQFWNAHFSAGVAVLPTSFITTGIFGVLAWIVFIGVASWNIVRMWIGRRESSGTVTAISIAALYTASFHLFSIPGVAFGLLSFVMIGLYVASATPHSISLRSFMIWSRHWKSVLAILGLAIFVIGSLYMSVSLVRVVASDATINRAVLYYQATGDAIGTSEQITKAIRIHPSDRAHRSAVQLGLLRLQQLNASADPNNEVAKQQLQATLEATIQHGLDAIALNSGNYQNWLELASFYAQLAGADVDGAYVNARAAYERALVENPTSPIPLLNLAQLEILQDNNEAALEYLSRAIQLKQSYAAAYYLGSQIYAAEGDYESALSAATQAVRYAPEDSEAWYNLGAVAFGAKKYEEAARSLEQAIARQERFANAMYVLGLAYYELDRKPEALAQFEALEKLDPEQEIVQQIISNLKAGNAPLPSTSTTSTPSLKQQSGSIR